MGERVKYEVSNETLKTLQGMKIETTNWSIPPGGVRLVSVKPVNPPLPLLKDRTEGVEPCHPRSYLRMYNFEILPTPHDDVQPDVVVENG